MSHSITLKHHPSFEMLDAKIATALKKILALTTFKRQVYLEEQKTQKDDRILSGRQIAHMIYEHFRITATTESFLELSDPVSVTLRENDVQGFDTKWNEVLFSMREALKDDILESVYKTRVRD